MSMIIIVALIAVAAAAGLATLVYRVLKAAHSGRPGQAAGPASPSAGHSPVDRAVLASVTRLIRLLLRLGIAPGPMRMLGVRGRASGIVRTAPVDVYDADGRTFLVATHNGGANWVRNLRAAGEGTLARGTRRWTLTAAELGQEEAARVLREVLGPRIARPLAGLALRQTLRITPGAAPEAFARAAADHPVFKLTVAPVPRRQATARRPTGPVIAITGGLAVAAAHAVLGAAGAVSPAAWIGGAVIGLLIAGAGNHARIFSRS
jgi:deazaflavin-dependent oxidoreductase (nitroreductase family)